MVVTFRQTFEILILAREGALAVNVHHASAAQAYAAAPFGAQK
jgi:hypothetical protein